MACAIAATAAPAPASAANPYVGYTEGEFIRARQLDPAIYPEETAKLLELSGAEVQRMAISWREIEPQPGQWDWTPFTAMVEADVERGIRPLFVVMNAPEWAWGPAEGVRCYQDPCNLPPAPEYLPDWQDFITKLLSRFPTAVGVELWNEPNNPYKWETTTGPDAHRYTELLCSTAEAAELVAPDVAILTGSPYLKADAPAGFVPYTDFLHQLYRAGAGACLDGLALHSYPQSIDLPPSDRFFTAIEDYRSVAAQESDAGRDLWVTEFGYPTPPQRGLTEAQQAQGTLKALRALQAMDDVRAALIYSMIEGLSDPGFGEVTRDYHAKLAFCVMGQVNTGVNPCGDRDGDGLTDVEEVPRSLDWSDPDTDHDGTVDGSDAVPRDPTIAGPNGAAPTITSAPPEYVTVHNAQFGFASELQDPAFQCRLDTNPWKACASPTTQWAIPDGRHAFAVRTVDSAGVAGEQATAGFTVDSTPPEVTIGSPSGTKRDRRQGRRTFSLYVSEQTRQLYCSLDQAKFTPCTSPYRTPRLKAGKHSLRAAGVDRAGNVGPIASKNFRIRRR